MAYVFVQAAISPNANANPRIFNPVSEGLANFTTGNAVFFCAEYFQNNTDPARTIVSVTDQAGTPITFTPVTSQQYAVDTGTLAFVIPSMPSGVTDVRLNMSALPAFGSIFGATEYSGLSTTVDGTGSSSASASTATDNATASATNSNQPAIVWSAGVDSVFTSTPAAGTGQTSRAGANGMRMQDIRVTSTGVQAATFTNTHGSACNHIVNVIILDEPGGGGGGIVLFGQVIM